LKVGMPLAAMDKAIITPLLLRRSTTHQNVAQTIPLKAAKLLIFINALPFYMNAEGTEMPVPRIISIR
jgi:hypothetical protein